MVRNGWNEYEEVESNANICMENECLRAEEYISFY